MQDDKNTSRQLPFWKTSSPEPEVSTEESLRMTADETEEQRQKARFRHRVVGSLTLLATLGVFCPLIFNPPSFITGRQADTDIPAIKKEPFYKLELAVNQPQTHAQAPGQSALKDLTTPNVVGQAPEARHAPKDADDQAGASQEKTPRGTASQGNASKAQSQAQSQAADGFFIQVMATSSEAGAVREMARYQAMGYPVYSVKVQKKSATLWRVRLGNFKTKAEADQVVEFLDGRKISHLPVQRVQKSAEEGVVQRLATGTQTQGAVSGATGTKASATKTSGTQTKSQTGNAKSSQAVAQKSNATAAAKTGAKGKTASSDPVGEILKAGRRDVIAEQIAKETKKK